MSGTSGDEDQSSEEEVKVLPQRSTRGRRAAVSDDDPEFWEEQVWADDPDDEEWDNNDEALSEDDQFDSDFFESESDEEDQEQEGAKDKELLRQEAKKRRHFDYERITRLRQKRLANSTRVWSLLESEKIGPKGKRITQEHMLEEAARYEKAVTKALAERALLELQNTTTSTEKPGKSHLPNSGDLAVFFSWSSEKTIANEEMRKSASQREMERLRGPYERQLYLFSNVAKPKESSFPDLYGALDTRDVELRRTRNASNSNLRALYMDPITLTPYNTKAEFGALREATRGEDYHSLVSAALSLIPKVHEAASASVGAPRQLD